MCVIINRSGTKLMIFSSNSGMLKTFVAAEVGMADSMLSN
jgi:hypothetical protein